MLNAPAPPEPSAKNNTAAPDPTRAFPSVERAENHEYKLHIAHGARRGAVLVIAVSIEDGRKDFLSQGSNGNDGNDNKFPRLLEQHRRPREQS